MPFVKTFLPPVNKQAVLQLSSSLLVDLQTGSVLHRLGFREAEHAIAWFPLS